MGTPDAASSPPPPTSTALSAAVQCCVSAKEYGVLYCYLQRRVRSRDLLRGIPAPSALKPALTLTQARLVDRVRAFVRVFLAVQSLQRLLELLKKRAGGARKHPSPPTSSSAAARLSGSTRFSLSIAALVVLHRSAHHALSRVRGWLRSSAAQDLRQRHPRLSSVLASRHTAALGASFAAAALVAYPQDQFRLSLTIYVATRAAEAAFNALEEDGYVPRKPRWWGSWMIMPLASGQLFYALLFERDCFPKGYGDFVLRFSPHYVTEKPASYAFDQPWPDGYAMLNGLAAVAEMGNPSITPREAAQSTSLLTSVSPLLSIADPRISNLSCAMLHPTDPSCIRTYLYFFRDTLPQFGKYFLLVFTLLEVPRWRAMLKDPIKRIKKLLRTVLTASLVVTGSVGTTWASVCLWQALLPAHFLPKARWLLGGLVGGCWSLLLKNGGREQFFYSLRSAIDSTWKMGRKHGWWRGYAGGDVLLVIASLAVLNVVYEQSDTKAVQGISRSALAFLREGDDREDWEDAKRE